MAGVRRALVGAGIRLALAALTLVAWLERALRPRRAFPRDPEMLASDPAWLAGALATAGAVPPGATVRELQVTPTKEQEAFRSRVARVDVTFACTGGSSERLALFAKFAPEPTSLREYAIYLLQENHTKEAAVYRELAPAGDLPLARPLHVGVHPLSGGLCLLLQRLDDAREVPEPQGCPAELAPASVRALAQVHARFWGDPAPAAAALRLTPPAVVDWLAHQLPGPDAPLFGAMLRHAWACDARAPITIQHGDARVGNQLFVDDPAAPGGVRAVLIDWQAARRGKGVFDVAYFLILSLEPAVRRAAAPALLRAWHQELLALGVGDYPWEQAVADADAAALLVLGFVTLPLMSAEASTTTVNRTGIDALGEAWARRMVAVVEELDLDAVARGSGLDPAALSAAFARSNDGAVARFPRAAEDRAAARAHVATHGPGLWRG